jgi:hypothetical protein
VVDAGALARRIEDTKTGQLSLMVSTGGAAARKVDVKR